MELNERFKEYGNITESENGGKVVKSTKSPLLDFFSSVGSLRNESEDKIINRYLTAREENQELTDNCVLYCRSVRDGLGERRTGRILLKKLAFLDSDKVIANFKTIVKTGRWDDLFCFFDTPIEDNMIQYIYKQFMVDRAVCIHTEEPISLLGKWMPSNVTSSNKTKKLAKRFCKAFDMSEKEYRRSLSMMRKRIDIVERKMSSNDWNEINYSSVPSLAMSKYQKAFCRQDSNRFLNYLEEIKSGKSKINSSTLYPYDICKHFFDSDISEVDEEQWKALPSYINNEDDVIVMADVSGSMMANNCRPIATSIGLATYFAQHNTSNFKNLYLTFSKNPQFIDISKCETLKDIFSYVSTTNTGYNTDLDKAFSVIYSMAKDCGKAPKALIVISDMQIDSWCNPADSYCSTIVDKWKEAYRTIGLTIPKLILWNVERSDSFLAAASSDVAFVSGYGIASFKNLTTLINKDAHAAMVEILSQPQFRWKSIN